MEPQHGLTKKECINCEKKDFSDRYDKTLEGDSICLDCAEEVRKEIMTPKFSNEEVEEYFTTKEEWKKSAKELSKNIRAHCKINNKDENKELKIVLNKAQEEAVKRFNKLYFGVKKGTSIELEKTKDNVYVQENNLTMIEKLIVNNVLVKEYFVSNIKVNDLESNGGFYKEFTKYFY